MKINGIILACGRSEIGRLASVIDPPEHERRTELLLPSVGLQTTSLDVLPLARNEPGYGYGVPSV